MAKFGPDSLERLQTCHPLLQNLFQIIVVEFDCSILEGHRPIERQIELFHAGLTKIQQGKHNVMPSLAVDVAPYIPGRKVPWPKLGTPTYQKDLALFYHFGGYVRGRAKGLGISLTWGGDWDRDFDIHDQTFDDLIHFELS